MHVIHKDERSNDENWVMLGSPAGHGGASQRGLWPIAPAPGPPTSGFTTDGFGRYGIYSLYPGGPNLSGALYSHASAIGRFSSGIPPSSGIQPPVGIPFHASHKESLFASTGYTFGTSTPPPYSPVIAATQLEFLSKNFNSNNIIIQPDFSPKKFAEKRCEPAEKCYQIKAENNPTCGCQQTVAASPSKKFADFTTGCSRTNPIEWSPIHVKKETPCQVSEITTSVSPVIKIEVTSPTQKVSELSISTMPSVTTSGNIPVGIAVARQRVQHNEILSSPSLPPAGLLTTVNAMTHLKEFSRYSETDSTACMAASVTAGVPGGGTLLQCTDERGATGWSMGGSHSSIATPTLWQYPAALPIEPMVPLPVPVPPVGVQLVRDPTSGHLLLLPTAGIEQVQQAVIWQSYQPPPPVILPPIPPPPLQLLTSTSTDCINATLHHQTHSARVVAVASSDTKTKLSPPVKLEADSMIPEPLTVYPSNLLAISRSQATSPVRYQSPPIEATPEEEGVGVQDASNQTDTPICSEDDDATMHTLVVEETKPTTEEKSSHQPDLSGLELLSNSIAAYESQSMREESKVEQTSAECAIPLPTPVVGLELLCALAEQRIKEETVDSASTKKIRKRKRKADKHLRRELKRAKLTSYPCPCQNDTRKETTSHASCAGDDWSPNELSIRLEMAELQKKYKQTQRELHKLKPKRKSKQAPQPTLPDEKLAETDESNRLPSKDGDSSNPIPLKKRKAGRPRKSQNIVAGRPESATETIVSKKGGFVSYLLAAKQQLQKTGNGTDSPPRYVDEPAKKRKKLSKIRPKLKAELTVKRFRENGDEDKMGKRKVGGVDPCGLTDFHLESSDLRVLTVTCGLFYAGRLNAVHPPDVYSIMLDGERGNKAHILSREEMLQNTIVEVSPTSTKDLSIGTRVCAYWSQQYRCLYPGSIAESTTDEVENRFATVEFDDGDSGRICLDDIRLLPVGYPIMEYDPNPLNSLCRRRRRTISTSADERKSIGGAEERHQAPPPLIIPSSSNLNIAHTDEESEHQKRKRLKKRKREKHGLKRKKHKHCDENCRHKKHHKRHRKHKKRHHSKSIGKMEAVQVEDVEKVMQVDEEEDVDVEIQTDVEKENEDESRRYEVTREDIENKSKNSKKRDRQESCESRSKMTAFLPTQQLWNWSGKGYKRPGTRGRTRKLFYKAIQRGDEIIEVGNSAVFLSTGRADRPFIGRVESMWESCGNMDVRVKWFYHPEETAGSLTLKYPGALFESPHMDKNEIQTISHKCEVLSLKEYKERLSDDPKRYATVYENNDLYYVAGYYDPVMEVLRVQKGIPHERSVEPVIDKV